LDDWTAKIEQIGTMGPLVDLSVDNLSLAIIGSQVCGHGSASGMMRGEIQGLFYRYKSEGGFDYIADFFIGPRSHATNERATGNGNSSQRNKVLGTHPGDSGTLWLLDPVTKVSGKHSSGNNGTKEDAPYLPLAIQWGANQLSAGAKPQAYVLATCL